MKRNLEIIFTFIFGIVLGVVIVGTYQAHTEPKIIEKPVPHIEYVYVEAEPEVITETEYIYVPIEAEPFYRNLTQEECDLLEQIAFAEAGGEGVHGMILVMNVVLNRVDAEGRFGDNVRDVIFAQGQFYTAGMTPNVSEDCHEALAMVLEGVDYSQGALYFNRDGYREGKEELFQYKNHYFTK